MKVVKRSELCNKKMEIENRVTLGDLIPGDTFQLKNSHNHIVYVLCGGGSTGNTRLTFNTSTNTVNPLSRHSAVELVKAALVLEDK